MEKTNFKLKSIENMIKQLKPELTKKFNLKEIGIFGSFIRGEQTASSDLDILVDFSGSITFFQFAEFENELSNILEINVDLVMKNSLKPRIGKYILNEVKYI